LKKIVFLYFILNSTLALSFTELDERLNEYVQNFSLGALKQIKDTDPRLTILGKKLFQDKKLSIAGDTSCQTCHGPSFGTAEPIPLSIGTGATGEGRQREISNGTILARNTPSLINKGQPGIFRMFWDSRVLWHPREMYFITPVKELNGDVPEYEDIVNVLNRSISKPLAVQALFPMISKEEMVGPGYEDLSPRQTWDLITARILENEKYEQAFNEIFPEEKINIGHIAVAIAHFEAIIFQQTNTRYDQYLRGNLNALSIQEKKGFLVFAEEGRCIRCHFGENLTNQVLHNIVVPPLGPGVDGRGHDRGAYENDPRDHLKYRFVVTPLRGIKDSAPYFHNGSALNLNDVIEHYNHPFQSIDNFLAREINEIFRTTYNGPLMVDRTPYRLFAIKESASPIIQPLRLSLEQKNALKSFLLAL
jgi:cytochrome c peroxidase